MCLKELRFHFSWWSFCLMVLGWVFGAGWMADYETFFTKIHHLKKLLLFLSRSNHS
jgi:hypothetical protein